MKAYQSTYPRQTPIQKSIARARAKAKRREARELREASNRSNVFGLIETARVAGLILSVARDLPETKVPTSEGPNIRKIIAFYSGGSLDEGVGIEQALSNLLNDSE